MRRNNAFRNRTFGIQTNLTVPQVMDKLKQFTTEEFADAAQKPEYRYYGTITGTTFHICNKKYGPYSSGPWIKGEVRKSDGKVTISFETDIEERIDIITKFLSPVFVVFGLLAIIAGITSPESRQIYVAVGAGLFVCPFAYVAFARRLLRSMQGDETRQFKQLVMGWQTSRKQPELREMALANR